MPRIRTIKPQFWTSGQISKLPKATALFFISLWNFAEDDGVVASDPRTLSLQVPIFRSQDVEKMVIALWKAGLIKRSPSDGLVLINGWDHQKIDKPRVGKYNTKEITWLEYYDSSNGSESSENDPRKDRIGKDRIGIGEDIIPEGSRKPAPSRDSGPTLGSQIWEIYQEEFVQRYGVAPVRNAKTNSLCAQLGKRLGKDALAVVPFFLKHNDGWLIKNQHSLGDLISKAESFHTQWQRGKPVTGAHVRQFEKQSTNMELLNRVQSGEVK